VNDEPTPAYPAPAPRAAQLPASQPPASTPVSRDGFYLGPLRVTLPLVLVLLVMVGSSAFLGWALLNPRDDQIPLMAIGFVALGASFAAIAIGSLVGMWRAASRARGGRAFALAIVGGLAGLGAIGAFTAMALLLLVSNT
jgi:hypothetical protein